jgi:drug/metabolite transporter (DMT)-like permease
MTGADTWGGIAAIVITATTGDVLQARAMKEIGDLGVIRKSHGTLEAARRVLTSPWFMFGLFFMALAFFSLLVTLSWNDVSFVGPASASLTFIANALAARLFLKERVGHRRWLAALFVAGGVALLAH